MIVRILILTILLNGTLIAKSWYFALDSAGKFESEFYLDPYYTALNIAGSLTSEPIPKRVLKEESSVYKELFINSWKLSFALAELSLNPFPLLGVGIKSGARGFYNKSEVLDGFNIVQALTSGFPDPGAFSLFLGNIASFTDSTGLERTGSGYSGLLLNMGNYHIRSNELIQDYWVEGMYKLKGSSVNSSRELSWSFGIGYKEHFNSGIIDELILKIKRERTDKDYRGWSIFKNSEVEYLVILNRDRALHFWDYWDKTAIRYFLLYGKRFPLGKSGDYAFSISIGVQRDVQSGYRGDLGIEKPSEWTFLIRPNFLF